MALIHSTYTAKVMMQNVQNLFHEKFQKLQLFKCTFGKVGLGEKGSKTLLGSKTPLRFQAPFFLLF